MFTKATQPLVRSKNMLVPLAASLYAMKQAKDMYSSQKNECGGILAYISKPSTVDNAPTNHNFDAISFSKTFANYLTKL
jgi:hypothetical protein